MATSAMSPRSCWPWRWPGWLRNGCLLPAAGCWWRRSSPRRSGRRRDASPRQAPYNRQRRLNQRRPYSSNDLKASLRACEDSQGNAGPPQVSSTPTGGGAGEPTPGALKGGGNAAANLPPVERLRPTLATSLVVAAQVLQCWHGVALHKLWRQRQPKRPCNLERPGLLAAR
ncbi:hypothetical protein THIX_20046 [Thiomonas sp. X19]|nr:hypothetical protein THIX_20046 [Thiomonas sp. X19]